MALRPGRELVDYDDEAVLLDWASHGSGSYVDDVDGWVQDLFHWRFEGPERSVRLYCDETGEVVALLALKPADDDLGRAGGTFLALLAVREGHGGKGYGSELMVGLVKHVRATHPGTWLIWRVDVANVPCQRMMTRLGFPEPEIAPDDRRYFEYSVLC